MGIFRSQGGGFESEIWGDLDAMGPAFQRTGGSNSLAVRMNDPAAIPDFDHAIRADPQMQLQAVQERSTTRTRRGPRHRAHGLATFVAIVMGIGAVFGAMNTMYAIVAARTREIGTLRALGFSRRSVLFSFVVESVFLALVGGVDRRAAGTAGERPRRGTGVGFAELAFAFNSHHAPGDRHRPRCSPRSWG